MNLTSLNETNTFSEFQSLVHINNLDENIFLFEHVNHKGLTWNDYIKKSIDWYDKEPIDVSELEIFDIKSKEKFSKKDIEIDYDYE
ncbi:MAG TPA: hypothetical protein OIM45_07060 [Clostridiaceae bacterium]|nr:hypothetical protein [Clostridiaceae bacterium]